MILKQKMTKKWIGTQYIERTKNDQLPLSSSACNSDVSTPSRSARPSLSLSAIVPAPLKESWSILSLSKAMAGTGMMLPALTDFRVQPKYDGMLSFRLFPTYYVNGPEKHKQPLNAIVLQGFERKKKLKNPLSHQHARHVLNPFMIFRHLIIHVVLELFLGQAEIVDFSHHQVCQAKKEATKLEYVCKKLAQCKWLSHSSGGASSSWIPLASWDRPRPTPPCRSSWLEVVVTCSLRHPRRTPSSSSPPRHPLCLRGMSPSFSVSSWLMRESDIKVHSSGLLSGISTYLKQACTA